MSVAVRLTTGVDIADETFYASFIDDWLKEGVQASPFITITQTAALLVYPFAASYHAIVKSADGLMLFCRCLYLGCSVAAAVIVNAFLRRLSSSLLGWIVAACVVAFIPFGLPAPSYNNFALQGVLAASCALGCAAMIRRGTVWMWAAGVAATIAVIAYPPMIVPLAVCYALSVASKTVEIRAVPIAIASIVLGAGGVAAVLTVHRLQAMLGQGAASPGLDPSHRIGVIAHQLTADWRFTAIWLAAILIGIMRPKLGALAVGAVQCGLLVSVLAIPPPLFIASHVAVFVIALSGLGLIADLRAGDLSRRALAVVYSTGLIGGVVSTLATSENGLFNFAIGGFPAAIMALTPAKDGFARRVASLAAPLAFMIVMLSSSLAFRYGEIGSATTRERIATGWYSGISATPEEAAIIHTASKALAPLGPRCTMSVVGWPVFYLVSPCVPRALMAYPINDLAQHAVFQATLRYYSSPANLPDYVVEYDDRNASFDFPFPDLHNWLDRYSLAEAYAMPFDGMMRIYRRSVRQDVKSP